MNENKVIAQRNKLLDALDKDLSTFDDPYAITFRIVNEVIYSSDIVMNEELLRKTLAHPYTQLNIYHLEKMLRAHQDQLEKVIWDEACKGSLLAQAYTASWVKLQNQKYLPFLKWYNKNNNLGVNLSKDLPIDMVFDLLGWESNTGYRYF
jgi:hypothetical protein